MAQASTAALPADADPAPPKKRGKLKWIIVAVAVLALAGGGFAAWRHFHAAESPGEAKAEPAKPPVFVALETFTVNLQAEDSQTHYLQTNITLKVANAGVEEQLKVHAPAIRNAVIVVLSGKHASELITTEGKQKLADEVQATINSSLPADAGGAHGAHGAPTAAPAAAVPAPETKGEGEPAMPAKPAGPVQSVLFTAFIIQ